MTPSAAQSDPITSASQEIAELESKLGNLSYKDELVAYIEMAKRDFLSAKEAQENLSLSSTAYEEAIVLEEQAGLLVTSSQSVIDGQTAVVEVALQNKNNSYASLEQANIDLQTASIYIQNSGNQGWQFTAYTLNRVGNFAVAGEQYCSGVLKQPYQGMPVCGRHENLYVIYFGKITAPSGVDQVSFAGNTDDGFRMYVDGQLVINQWVDQGATWSPFYYHNFTPDDRTIDVVFHYFNGGGPGSFHVGWGHSGIWTGVSPSAMSYGQGATQEQLRDYNLAVQAQQVAQSEYEDKLSIYNQELQTLSNHNSSLSAAISDHANKVTDLSNAILSKDNAAIDYSQKLVVMNETISKAWESYNTQFAFEEKQRIAAAIAGAIKPIPEPSPEPTQEPSPEPSPEPTPEPTPDPTPEPETTPETEPTPESSEESPLEEESPTPTPSPSPAPSPEPSLEPTPTPTENSGTDVEEQKPIVIPEKITVNNLSSVLANLTSKDNLAQLTTEQQEVISGTLGIQATELSAVIELASKDESVAKALEEFSERAEENADAPMPYTLADAITETQAEEFLSNPLSAITDINVGELLSNFSELGSDMTDDQREKAQEVIIPVVIVSQIASSIIAMRR
jgi:hypothetical protein